MDHGLAGNGAREWHGLFYVAPAGAPCAPGINYRVVMGLLREPFSLRAHRERLYAGLSLVLALAGFVFAVVTVAVGVGVSLSFAGLLVGLPLIIVSLLGARRFGAANRVLAARLLGLRVAAPAPLRRRAGVFGLVRVVLTDRAGWRAVAYLVLKLPVSVIGSVAASSLWLYGLPYLTFPLWWEVFDLRRPHLVTVHGVVINTAQVIPYVQTLPAACALIPLGATWVLAAPWLTRAVIAVDRALIAGLLGPVSLSQRVRDLEQTRARAVDDSAARLRRIERDLHDGAQAELVAVAMKLGLAREKLGGASESIGEPDLERVRALVDGAHLSARQAITQLRDLARGIHPPVLDQGLGTALATLAASSAMPVELIVDLPDRPSPAIETIAYFCAAELLVNAAKHSGARHATLEAVHVLGLLRVRVGDDGHGGAHPAPAGGLSGLAERLRTVDGRMEISSPPGGPTVVTMEMPSHT
jgi:signal transduction histidine kinase